MPDGSFATLLFASDDTLPGLFLPVVMRAEAERPPRPPRPRAPKPLFPDLDLPRIKRPRHERWREPALVPPRILAISPLMLVVERIVTRHANAVLPMPNNPVLGELSGGLKRQSAARALDRLEAAGHISIERDGLRRRVSVTATGATTGWGDSRPGHAPYSTYPRGTARPERRTRLAESPALPAYHQDAGFLDQPWVAPTTTERRTINTTRADTCQWPMWGDGERPTFIFCDAPAAGRSFCAAHDSQCFEKRSKRR